MAIKPSVYKLIAPIMLTVVFGGTMPAAAKGKPKPKTSNFSVGCLSEDAVLQSAEGIPPTQDPAAVTISPSLLWPPNHKFRTTPISMSLAADSASPVDVTLTVNDITDDQVADDDAGGAGCGPVTSKQGADWSPTDFSTLTASGTLQNTHDAVSISGVQLRAERCVKDGTRTYEVSVTCCDITNAVCDSTPEVLDVIVPKNKGHHS
jgi:hypothetical protein